MSNLKWVQYKSYSGLKIDGTARVKPPEEDLHMERAYWLTAMLEAPRYGSVQSYDGAAMSGGPLHNIAVYPRSMTQGSFFPLLRRIELSGANTVFPVWDALSRLGWYVARDGKLRNWETGKPVSGRAIRNEFTPLDGKVPRRGAARNQATRWIQAFHTLFADPATFAAQRDFAIDYLINTRAEDERKFYGDRDLQILRVDTDNASVGVDSKHFLPLCLDFAMCVYHSHSVNGPTPAKSVLLKTLTQEDPWKEPERFTRRLIYNLGKKRYGRWRDTVDGRNRYDRTRYWAKKGGLWPDMYFESYEHGGYMPNNLPNRW